MQLYSKPDGGTSIWDEMDSVGAASESDLNDAEKRLGVTLPPSLRDQMKIQNGGALLFYGWDEHTAAKELVWIADPTVDGILPIEEWELASDNDGLSSLEMANHELLVSIAGHSEDQLCLDYRKNGPNGEPGLTAFFTTASQPETGSHESITQLIDVMIRLKKSNAEL